MATASPEKQLFESFVRHATWCSQEALAPAALRLDTHAWHLGLHCDDALIGSSSVVGQGFASGLLASCMTGRLRQPVTWLNECDDGFAPCLALHTQMAGRFYWTDGRGRRHEHGARSGEVWGQRGRVDWRQSTLLPGRISQSHVAVCASLLGRWLRDMPRGEPRRRIEQCLGKNGARSEGDQESSRTRSLPAEMAATAARLQALLLDDRQPPTLARRLQIEGQSLALLGAWLEMPADAAHTLQSRCHRAAQDAIDIIRAEYAADLSISELARRVGLNECYLKHAFRELTGMGIAAFVRRQRMQTALAMLEEGRHTVLEVARHVGYSNPGHFARVFRNQHGCLPSDVRR